MQNIPDYQISKKIIEDDSIRIFRGYWIAGNGQHVLVKTLKAETTNLAGASNLAHELEITRKLDADGIIKPMRLERAGGVPVLIMEDTEAVPFKQYLRLPLSHLPTIFAVAIQLVEILGELHQNGVVHGNLKPDNIFIEPGTGRVKITGFDTVLFLTGENQDPALMGRQGARPICPRNRQEN